MRKFLFICLALILAVATPAAHAQADDPTYGADYQAADEFQNALKANDRGAVAALITYPLNREKPLTPIANAKEFLAHWDEYFDEASIKSLLDSKADQYGWRGIALANGTVWFANGHIASIFTETDVHKTAFKNASQIEGTKLYPTVRGYSKIAFQCSTKTESVRTQYHGKDLRYFAWKKGRALSSKPDIELRDGVYDPQGTGGNYNLIFKNKGYTYQLEIGQYLCGEDCNDYLNVMKGDKTVSHQICTAAE
jgi:hypothetical protein